MEEAQRQYGVWFPSVKTKTIEGVEVGIKEMDWSEIDKCAKEIGKGVQQAFAIKSMMDKFEGMTMAQVMNMGAGAIVGQIVASFPDHIRVVVETGTNIPPEIIQKAKGKIPLLLFQAVIDENKELKDTFFEMLERFGIKVTVGESAGAKGGAAGSPAASPASSITASQKSDSEN